MKKNHIAFIGCGNMGRSLMGGLLAAGHPAALLCAADPDPAQRAKTQETLGVAPVADNEQAIAAADVVVLAVKPQAMQATVSSLAAALQARPPLLISIAAGVPVAVLEGWLGGQFPIVLAMPNTPALIGAGAAALYANAAVSDEQRALAEGLLRSVGMALWLEEEALMDAVTALSGSGPAYVFLLIEVLEKAAIKLGLGQAQARLLSVETVSGAAKMARESKDDAATLRQQVTSPGGTTEAALKVLTQQGDMEGLFADALGAARRRSVALADEFGQDAGQ